MKSKLYQTLAVGTVCLWLQNLALAEWAQSQYNPQPLANDLILPMPCGGKIVFRQVATANQEMVDDMQISLGSNETDTDSFTNATQDYIAGSFHDAKNTASNSYYYLAKYELTALQYKSVMDAECPVENIELRKPMVDISWFEANDFSNKYNLWLIDKHFATIPKEDGELGFVRLPTDVEWEYAARGGLLASPAEFVAKTFPMPEGLNEYVWYAGPNSANGKLQVIGNKKANALGLYDILGNAAEMVFDSFRLSKLNRYHGQRGGLIVRGGSYLTPEGQISAAERIEKPYYSSEKHAATKAQDVGMRLALVAPILTSKNKLATIRDEWNSLTKTKQSRNDKNIDSHIENLDKASRDNSQVTEIVKQLKKDVYSSNQQKEEQTNKSIQSFLRSGAFLCITLRNSWVNIDESQEQLKSIVKKGEDDKQIHQEQLKKYAEFIKNEGITSKQLFKETQNSIKQEQDRAAKVAKVVQQQQTAIQNKISQYKDYHKAITSMYFDTILVVNDDYRPEALNKQFDQAMLNLVSALDSAKDEQLKSKYQLQRKAYQYFKQHVDGYSRTGMKNTTKWTQECELF